MECVLDMNFIQSEAVQENSNSNENYKNKRVMEVLDYLQEEAYLSDICLSDDPFEILFSSLYDYIERRGLSKKYTNIMHDFICSSLSKYSNLESVGLENFMDNLNALVNQNMIKPPFSEMEIVLLKNKVKQKSKALIDRK